MHKGEELFQKWTVPVEHWCVSDASTCAQCL